MCQMLPGPTRGVLLVDACVCGLLSYRSNTPRYRTAQPPAPEYWKARYGAFGVYPFRKGDSDDTMAFGVKSKPQARGQQYFKAKYGPTGYAMFNLNQAADKEAAQQIRLPQRQWHAEGIVRPTEYEQ